MSDELGVKKFQWSKFSPDRSEQIVIRTDDQEEFTKLIDDARGILPTGKAFPDDEGNRAHAPEQTQQHVPVCPKHNKMLTKGQWGWFCKSKDDTQPKGWCTYKPK